MPSLRRIRRKNTRLRGVANAARLELQTLSERHERVRTNYAALVHHNQDVEEQLDHVNAMLHDRDHTLSHPLHRCADAIIRAGRVLSSQLRAFRS